MADPTEAGREESAAERRSALALVRGKSRTVVALGVLLIAALLDWNWPWGVVFVYWAAEAVRDRQTYLVEDVARDAHPELFWIIVCTWLLSGGYLFALDLRLVGPQ